jgi:hypothetical protein
MALGFLSIPVPFATAASGIATTLSLASTPQPAVYYAGQAITYTATVAATGMPTGTVIFTVDGSATTPYPVDPSRNATIVLHPSAGAHFISANYSGDQNYAPSASEMLTQVINKAATSVDMASNPPQIAQPVSIRAAVSVQSPGTGPAGGTVTFVNGTNPIGGCVGLSLQNGVAVCNTRFAQQGSVNIAANYSGDANTFASTALLPLTVGKCSAGAYLAAAPRRLRLARR